MTDEREKQLLQEINSLRERLADLEQAVSEGSVLLGRGGAPVHALNIFESSLDMIVAVDLERRITDFNRAAEATFGYRRREVLGRHVEMLYADREESQAVHQDILASGGLLREIRNRRKNGEIFISLLSASALTDRDGRLIGVMGISRDISAQKKAEERLKETERRYLDIADNIPGVVYQFRRSPEGEYSFPFVSLGVEELFGLRVEEILNHRDTPFRLIVPEDLEGLLVSIEESARDLCQWNKEFRIRLEDGRVRWMSGSSIPHARPEGDIIWDGFILDITDKKRAEEVLHASERKYRAIVENTGTAMLILEKDTTVSLCNSELSRFSGYSKEEIENRMKWTAFVHPGDLDRMVEYHHRRRIKPEETPGTYEFRFVDRSGGIRHMYLTVGMIDSTDQSVASCLDITELKKYEEALRRNERKYRDLANSLPQTIFEMDRGYRLTFVNDAGYRYFGYTPEELETGLSALDMIVPEERDAGLRNVQQRMNGGVPETREYTARRKDGTTFPVNIYASVIMEDGEVRGVRGIMIDISMQKKAEEALKESEEMYRTLVNTSPDAITLTDMNGNILLCNQQAVLLHGFSGMSELIGRNVFDFFAPEGKERALRALRRSIARGYVRNLEFRLLRRDGSAFDAELSSSIIYDARKRPKGFIGVERDISERKRMEEEIQRTQKLESLGILAGGIAHDFNNILTGILGNISLARKFLPEEGRAGERLHVAENACLQARSLTAQLLTFSKGGEPVKRVVSLNPLIRDAVNFSMSGSSVKCQFRLEEDLRPVEIDEGQIRQVINNIIINAEQAMEKGGRITVSAENVDIDASRGKPPEGHYVRLLIADQGEGIPEA